MKLEEKQKLRFNYGISERQLVRYLKKARSQEGSTGTNLLKLLENRLDNVCFRLGFGPTKNYYSRKYSLGDGENDRLFSLNSGIKQLLKR